MTRSLIERVMDEDARNSFIGMMVGCVTGVIFWAFIVWTILALLK